MPRLLPRSVLGACLLLVAAATPLIAQDTGDPAPVLTADRLDVDFTTQEAVYSGNARAEFGAVVLRADEMRWDRSTGVVTARGRAVLERGAERLVADELTYTIETQAYSVRNLRLGRSPFFVSGALLTGSPEEIRLEDLSATFGEPNPWAPTLRARSATYYPQRERLRAEGARVGLGFAQPLPLPSTEIRTTVPLLINPTFAAGLNNNLGASLIIGTELPYTDRWGIGAEIGLFSKRGVMIGPTGSYQWDDPRWGVAEGTFSTGYISDSGDRATDQLGRPVPRNRGLVTWEHHQVLSDHLTFKTELNYWSDSEVLRDFRPGEFFPVQEADTFAELTYTGTHTVSDLFTRGQLNRFHAMRERLPEASFDLLPTPLFGGWLHEFHAAYVSLRDDPPGSILPTLRSDRLNTYYGLSRPWHHRDWLSFTPVAGGRLTHYARATGGRSDYTRALGEVGFDAELNFNGTFAVKNERWGIDGLRHLVTPRLSYRYIPDADKGAPYIPPLDRPVFDTYLEPLGLGARRQIDVLNPTHTLRFGLDQRLQTRHPDYGSRDLAALNLALDANFDTPAGTRTLSTLHSALRLTPAPWLEVDLYHRTTPGRWELAEFNTALTLRSADQWRLTFSNHYLRGDIEEYIGAFAYRVNEAWEGYTRWHFDDRRSRFVEQTYGIRQTLGNRWQVGYEVSFYEGPRRESDFGFQLVLESITF